MRVAAAVLEPRAVEQLTGGGRWMVAWQWQSSPGSGGGCRHRGRWWWVVLDGDNEMRVWGLNVGAVTHSHGQWQLNSGEGGCHCPRRVLYGQYSIVCGKGRRGPAWRMSAWCYVIYYMVSIPLWTEPMETQRVTWGWHSAGSGVGTWLRWRTSAWCGNGWHDVDRSTVVSMMSIQHGGGSLPQSFVTSHRPICSASAVVFASLATSWGCYSLSRFWWPRWLCSVMGGSGGHESK